MRLVRIENPKPVQETAKGKVKKVLDKVVKKVKRIGKKSTGHELGDDLRDMMAQYAKLKNAGKGDTPKAKALGEKIGKIKNSINKSKKKAKKD